MINYFSFVFVLLFALTSSLPVPAELEDEIDVNKDNDKSPDVGDGDPLWPLYDINEQALKVLEAKEERIENGEDVEVDGDLALAEHLEGLKVNRHGKLNEKYDEELFLGEEIEQFENGDMTDLEKEEELRKICELIDLDKNGYIEENELAAWVLTKTREHFDHAKLANKEKFQQLDSDENGLLEWEEYLIEFIAQKGLDWEKIANKMTLKESVEANIPDFLRDDFEALRDTWIEVSNDGNLYDDNSDNDEDYRQVNLEQPLTLDLFVEFQNPETSEISLKFIVEDFIEELDENNDGKITLMEYRGMETETHEDVGREFLEERENEFITLIDINNDGEATPDEIRNFLDPLSEANARTEARQLIGYGDDNGDNKLSIKEVINNSEFFIDTKLYNYARAVHYDL